MQYIRFATYIVLFFAAWIVARHSQTIPVELSAGPVCRADEVARSANRTFTEEKSILECQRSGYEVATLAKSALAKNHLGEGSGVAQVPIVRLKTGEGRIIWVLTFDYPDPPPGGPNRFVVEVDDASGQICLNGNPEPNQALLPTPTAVTTAASHPSRQP